MNLKIEMLLIIEIGVSILEFKWDCKLLFIIKKNTSILMYFFYFVTINYIKYKLKKNHIG